MTSSDACYKLSTTDNANMTTPDIHPKVKNSDNNSDNNMVTELSVTALSSALKNCVESNFSMIRVKGEISGYKRHTSGHAYFSIKDDLSVIDCVCWNGVISRILSSSKNIQLRDGVEAIISGKVTTYAGRSKYQISVSNIELSGQGDLLLLLQQLKEKLAKEGLFAQERKKTLPRMPRRIGIITSATGAVIRDMLHRISERMPSKVILYPVNVQGEGSAKAVSHAISEMDKKSNADVLIVARGGGSIEDLWTFNEEVVVRAIANCSTPIISAIGHETDTTLADYAADYRAPTPTAAAEKVVPVRLDLLTYLDTAENRLRTSINRKLSEASLKIESLARGLPDISTMIEERYQWIDDRFARIDNALRSMIEKSNMQLDNLSQSFDNAAKNYFNNLEQRFNYLGGLLESYSHKGVLKRGYSIVKSKDNGEIISSINSLKNQNKPTSIPISITLSDGELDATINKFKATNE